ncbi:hypothetical protein AB4501_23100, partial [Vibrio sp. 10N.222.55.E8]
IQVEGESAPRQIANKYEFVLEKFGLFYSKAKTMLNRNLRKKSKKNKATQQTASSRVEHINQMLDEAQTSDIPEWEDYSPPE